MKFNTLCLAFLMTWIHAGSAEPPAAPKTEVKVDEEHGNHIWTEKMQCSVGFGASIEAGGAVQAQGVIGISDSAHAPR